MADITFGGVIGVFMAIALSIGVGLYGCPQYNVYTARLDGEAELAKANQNRQIAVTEAQAKKEAASLLAETEVIRAEGVAKANQIIANGLGGPEGYLRYLYIQMLEEQKNGSIIYVPTEAGLPILEAGRLNK